MRVKTKTKIMMGAFIALVALPLVAADYYELWCLDDGESVDLGALCNPDMDIWYGPTILCMRIQDNGKICPAILNICNGQGLSCANSTTGNTTIDTTPPTLNILSPLNESTFTSRNVLIELTASERADITYQKSSDPRRWTNLCSNCLSYSNERSFDEGPNEITIRAIDRANNEAYYTLLFYIDSKEPKIKSLSPDEGFASGTFQISFAEDNPRELILYYGNYGTGFRESSFNILTDCIQSQGEFDCTKNVNLADYDGERIEVYATLEDVAGSIDESTHSQLDVDNTIPIINNFDYVLNGKKVKFTLEINEPYFKEVTYQDNSESKPKQKNLCTKLVNNICEKEISFNKDGTHEVIIRVKDRAGNEATRNVTFSTDSAKPKIKEILPEDGFASGLFEITFEENNPVSLVLEYGNLQTGLRIKEIELSECTVDDDQYYCLEQVSLEDYDGQEIEYKFNITDTAAQVDEKQQSNLAVDISYPIITNLDYTIEGENVFFSIELDERYLKEISFIDNLDPRPREKRLCNKLVNNICEKKVSFRNDGDHEVTLKVTDLAGNVTAQSIEFFTDSEKPKITMVSPEKEFTSGLFEVEFKEQNPTSLVLEYGNSALGFLNYEPSLENDCVSDGEEYYCSVEVDLSDYEGYEVMYDFTVTDRAGQTASDGAAELIVDVTFPEFDSLTYELVSGTKANVILQATEPNVETISYLNLYDAKPREKTFCSRLSSEGICEKKITVNPGTNVIDFTIVDKAGNSAVQQLVIQN